MPKKGKELLTATNSDFKGTIEYDAEGRESVDFHNGSAVRIWYNDDKRGFKPHWHDAMEIIMVVEGGNDIAYNGSVLHVAPGDILIIPPGVMHELKENKQAGIRFIFLFDMSLLKNMRGYAGIMSAMVEPVVLSKQTHPRVFFDIYELLVKMRNDYFYGQNYSDFTVYSSFMNLLVLLAENRDTDEKMFSNTKPKKQQVYVKEFNRLLEYINEHFNQCISLEDAAENIGFSKYYFSRLFKQYTDYTFCDYLTLRRIKAAKEMLADPSVSVIEVAMGTGFSSISTFNRVFKDAEGCTPSAYRSKKLVENEVE